MEVKMEVKTKKWEGEIPVHYLYTCGIAGERFFREIKDNGKFVGTKCEKCNVTYVPPRIYCERCFAELNKYLDVGTKGTVESYTLCKEAADGTKLSKPAAIASIRLDGTNGGLIHRIGGIDPENIKIGMRVEAVFTEKSKRTGHINDVLHFRPI
jgi:uncharacterized OB-fold protein